MDHTLNVNNQKRSRDVWCGLRVFGLAYPKVNQDGDFYEDGVFYFVTPKLFSDH